MAVDLFGRNKGKYPDLGISEGISALAGLRTGSYKTVGDIPKSNQTTDSNFVYNNDENDPERQQLRTDGKGIEDQKTTPTTTTKTPTGGGTTSGGGGSDYSKQADKMKKQEEENRKRMESNYNERYDYLTETIKGQRTLAEQNKNTALSDVDAELTNLLTKAETGKADLQDYYNEQEDTLRNEKETLDKELARIFQSRNITESSYYLEKKADQDDNFLKTLGKIGTEEARRLKEVDSDIAYYQTQALSNRTKIEQAYNETLQAIESDLTKTSFEKEDALARLDQEFNNKINTIDQRILEYTIQRDEFRSKASKYSVDSSYTNDNMAKTWKEKTGLDMKSFMQSAKDPNYIQQALKASVGSDGKADPDVYAMLRSSASSGSAFDAKYAYMVSDQEKKNLNMTVKKYGDTEDVFSEI